MTERRGQRREGNAELEERFEGADCPTTLQGLEGHWDGAILALGGADALPPLLATLGARAARGFARGLALVGARPGFPWLGLSLHAEGRYDGAGANRLWTPLGEREVAHFRARLEASRIDGRPCLLLDYTEDNPAGPLRQLHDELRLDAGGAGLLGVTFGRFRGETRCLSWFSLEAARES